MAGVFMSYDRDDADRAKYFARVLEAAGHMVWWDLHVRSGAQFSKVIEEALNAADAVVVLWSRNSVESPWVRDEAAAGRDSGRLVPVTIDGTQPPLGFRQFQTIDLSRWHGRGKPAALQTLLADITALAPERAEPYVEKPRPVPKMRQLRWDWRVATAALAVVLIVIAVAVWQPWSTGREPTLVVRSAAPDAASRSIARDLAVELASLQGAQPSSIHLVSETEAAAHHPDFVFEVSQSSGSSPAANVVLTDKEGAIIWSKDFQPASVGDLKQQLGFAAARVLACAGEAVDRGQKLAHADTFKLYLNSCAQLAESSGDNSALVTSFRQVVADAPRFVPAWRKLLLVEADQIESEVDDDSLSASDAALLRRHIAAARALVPRLPEGSIAEVSLISANAVGRRMQLLDSAKSVAPDNPAVLSRRSRMLEGVGRMHDAIDDASRAAQLDPLSPSAREYEVNALAFAGEIDAARRKVEEVEHLWPGSAVAQDAEFRFNVRSGDPRVALPYAQQRALKGIEYYLEARLDSSKIEPYISWLLAAKDRDWGHLGVLVQAYGEFHREDQLYRVLSSWPNHSDFGRLEDIWFRPALRQFRRDPRFMQVMAETPLLNYWRTSGRWPDFCYAPDLGYDCKAEAAKLAA